MYGGCPLTWASKLQRGFREAFGLRGIGHAENIGAAGCAGKGRGVRRMSVADRRVSGGRARMMDSSDLS